MTMSYQERIHALEAVVQDQRDYIALLESGIDGLQKTIEEFKSSNTQLRRLTEGLECDGC